MPPRPVYSSRFIHVHDSTAGAGYSALVPAGYVFDVRDVQSFNGDSLGGSVGGWKLGILGGAHPVGIQPPISIGGMYYSWDGRMILTAGEELELVTIGPHWDIIVSGYQLTTP